jgi:hypothetical protein
MPEPITIASKSVEAADDSGDRSATGMGTDWEGKGIEQRNRHDGDFYQSTEVAASSKPCAARASYRSSLYKEREKLEGEVDRGN